MSCRRGLRADSTQFTLEGKPFRILGGSVHYFRVPRPYWRDRLLQMKACGLNTLTTYVPWNLHEPERGTFNFHDQLDLKSYIRLAAEMGLWVILRPGPYICLFFVAFCCCCFIVLSFCAWTPVNLFTFSSWLLQDKDMQLRTTYPGFVNAVNLYFDKLIPTVKPLMVNPDPVLIFPLKKAADHFSERLLFLSLKKECLRSRGVNELLMTSDNWEGLKYGGVAGALKTINFQRLSVAAIQHLADMQPQKPLLVMEYWSGWFDVWGEHHRVFHAEDMLAVVSELLSRGVSINLYMFHGGTNFGFMNGALDFGTYKPQVTSYDYDAPLSEAGDCTMKYQLLRNLFSQYHSEPLPQVPSPQERRAYEPVVMQQHLSLWDSLQFTDKALNMENLPVNNNNGQSYGYTLYETTVTSGGVLNSMNNIRDRALVFVEREYVGYLDYKTHKVTLPEAKGERMLSFLVENCGRVNYGKALNDQRKGIVGDIVLNRSPLRGFNIFCLDMKPCFINRSLAVPGFVQARLNVDGSPRDTFIQMTGWGKGVVFVNGQNLGRYWFIGPQRFLYLPGHWLRSGENQIILFEEQRTNGKVVFTENADHGKTIDVYKLPFCTLL
uniref:Si:dkey-224e22.2 n=1 Tax=Oryzias sinensis TaxID=183150 RepID=A0A8C7XRB5_9TELE